MKEGESLGIHWNVTLKNGNILFKIFYLPLENDFTKWGHSVLNLFHTAHETLVYAKRPGSQLPLYLDSHARKLNMCTHPNKDSVIPQKGTLFWKNKENLDNL